MPGYTYGGLGRYTEAIASLWLKVRLEAAPDAIEAPAKASRPTSNDTMAGYLERSLVDAIAAKDWAFASRILKMEQIVTPSMGGDAMDDLIGIRALIVGGNHEIAGQWDEAVAIYSNALNSTGPHLPLNELSSRLHNIQIAHPDDYAAGLKLPDPTAQQAGAINAYRARAGLPGMPVSLPGGKILMPSGQIINSSGSQ
jgi:hypothetical protein